MTTSTPMNTDTNDGTQSASKPSAEPNNAVPVSVTTTASTAPHITLETISTDAFAEEKNESLDMKTEHETPTPASYTTPSESNSDRKSQEQIPQSSINSQTDILTGETGETAATLEIPSEAPSSEKPSEGARLVSKNQSSQPHSTNGDVPLGEAVGSMPGSKRKGSGEDDRVKAKQARTTAPQTTSPTPQQSAQGSPIVSAGTQPGVVANIPQQFSGYRNNGSYPGECVPGYNPFGQIQYIPFGGYRPNSGMMVPQPIQSGQPQMLLQQQGQQVPQQQQNVQPQAGQMQGAMPGAQMAAQMSAQQMLGQQMTGQQLPVQQMTGQQLPVQQTPGQQLSGQQISKHMPGSAQQMPTAPNQQMPGSAQQMLAASTHQTPASAQQVQQMPTATQQMPATGHQMPTVNQPIQGYSGQQIASQMTIQMAGQMQRGQFQRQNQMQLHPAQQQLVNQQLQQRMQIRLQQHYPYYGNGEYPMAHVNMQYGIRPMQHPQAPQYSAQPRFIPVDFKQKFAGAANAQMRGSYPVLHPAPTFYPLKASQQKTKIDLSTIEKQPPNALYEKVPMLNQATGRINMKYQCCVCHSIFSARSNVMTHLRVHTGEKPFVCDECGRGFAQATNLKRHKNVHDKRREKIAKMSASQNQKNISTGQQPQAQMQAAQISAPHLSTVRIPSAQTSPQQVRASQSQLPRAQLPQVQMSQTQIQHTQLSEAQVPRTQISQNQTQMQ